MARPLDRMGVQLREVIAKLVRVVVVKAILRMLARVGDGNLNASQYTYELFTSPCFNLLSLCCASNGTLESWMIVEIIWRGPLF